MVWSQVAWDASRWREDAACRDVTPELFFPVGATGVAVDQIRRAKEVCSQCQVCDACLAFAVTTNQEFGVWGGLDEDERRDVRRQWRRAKRPGTRTLGPRVALAEERLVAEPTG